MTLSLSLVSLRPEKEKTLVSALTDSTYARLTLTPRPIFFSNRFSIDHSLLEDEDKAISFSLEASVPHFSGRTPLMMTYFSPGPVPLSWSTYFP